MDVNCDMGELEDTAHEAALMEYISSANIACGGHAGDETTMERTARQALARGVRIGAHPSYPDRVNFGRVEMELPDAEIERAVREQVERLERVVRRLGAEITHVKAHGALYNVAARNERVALAIGRAMVAWNPSSTLFGLLGAPCLDWWRGMGLNVSAEAFADRRYEPDGSLRSRKFADALITDPHEASAQAARFAREGKAQTLCVHGDTPGSVEILRAVRAALRG